MIPANATDRTFAARGQDVRLAINRYISDLAHARKRYAATGKAGRPFEFIVTYEAEGRISPAVPDVPPEFLAADRDADHAHGEELPPEWPYDTVMITSRSWYEQTTTTFYVEELEYEKTRVAVHYQGSYPWGVPTHLFGQIEKKLAELGLS